LKLGAYLLAAEAQMPEDRLWRKGSDKDAKRKMDAAARLAKLQIERYSGDMISSRIEAMIRTKAAQGVTWFLIDSLQLVDVPGEPNEWKASEKFARRLQAIATQTGVYILATCEWKKKDEPMTRRKDQEVRKPNKSDYKGGGGVVHAADELLICWPPEESRTDDWLLVVDKSRSGPTPRDFKLKFIGEEHRFEDVRYGV